MNQMKRLPSNIQIEQEVLGYMIAYPRDNSEIINNLRVNDFYLGRHQEIYKAMCELYATGKGIEVMLIAETLGKENMEKIKISYLMELESGATSIDITSRIAILKEKSYRRKCIKELEKSLREAYNEEIKIDNTVSSLQNSLIQDSKNSQILNESQLMMNVMEDIEKKYRNGGAIPGMKTGFKSFDFATNGLKAGELVVIAGRPSMGKTLTALQLAEGASNFGHKVGIIEMEMTDVGIGTRRISSACMIDSANLQRGQLTDADFTKIASYTEKTVKNNNIFTDCGFYQNLLTIKSKAKSLKMSVGLDILVIDHLTLMDLPKHQNMSYSIAEVTRAFKMMAKELEICIILVSQLNRNCEQRPDKRPMMSDLGDSKSIEQDADMVMFCYRDEYYDEETADKGIMEWIIRKQRNGQVGTLKMKYMANYQKIIDFANI